MYSSVSRIGVRGEGRCSGYWPMCMAGLVPLASCYYLFSMLAAIVYQLRGSFGFTTVHTEFVEKKQREFAHACTFGGNFELKIPRMRDSFGQPTGKPLYKGNFSSRGMYSEPFWDYFFLLTYKLRNLSAKDNPVVQSVLSYWMRSTPARASNLQYTKSVQIS